MPHFPFTATRSWWNSQEQPIRQPLSKSLSLKVGSPAQPCEVENHEGDAEHHPHNQDSSLAQSTDQTHQELAVKEDNSSRNQYGSSDSVQVDEHVDGQLEPVLVLANPSFGAVCPQTHFPYAYGDPYVNGLYTAYGPQIPQMIGIPPARLPLPIELADDGPIYVNAKQYNGILRRRQMRAKLEAENKLFKSRKPYLHESRHRHALNRVRGSGGRFLSTKKSEQSNSTHSDHNLGSGCVNYQSETVKRQKSAASSSPVMCITNNNAFFRQPNPNYTSSKVEGGMKGHMCDGTPRRSFPVVR